MRELRFVGSADSVSGTATHDGKSKDAGDGQHQLVFELVDGTKRFRLALDTQVSADLLEALGAVAAAQIDRAPDEPPGSSGKEHPVSELRPRDIQMRVRAGEEPQALADEAGLTLDKVMRFAYPVLQERIRVVDEARRARAHGGDGQSVPFGELFDNRVAALGVEPTGVGWDSVRRPDGGWTLTARFAARAAATTDEVELIARFSFALLNRSVSALNDTASDLLLGHPLAALRPQPAPEPPAEIPAAVDVDLDPARAAGGDSARPGVTRLTSVPAWPGEDAAPAGEESEAPREHRSPIRLPSRRQKAHTHPLPVSPEEDLYDDLFDQEAFETPAGTNALTGAPIEPAADPRPGTAPATPPRTPTALRPTWDEPPLPLELSHPEPAQGDTQAFEPDATTEPSPQETAPADAVTGADDAAEGAPQENHSRRGRNSDKPRMPSWDDILLGVRRKSE